MFMILLTYLDICAITLLKFLSAASIISISQVFGIWTDTDNIWFNPSTHVAGKELEPQKEREKGHIT